MYLLFLFLFCFYFFCGGGGGSSGGGLVGWVFLVWMFVEVRGEKEEEESEELVSV